MKKFRIFETIAVIAILSLTVLSGVSCAKAQANGSQELSGVTWVLKSFGDASSPTQAVADRETTLTFDKVKKEISGNGGVNGYGGNYAVNKDQLIISGVVHTLMASDNDALNNQETAFFKILDSARNYKIEGKQLTITGSEGILILIQK